MKKGFTRLFATLLTAGITCVACAQDDVRLPELGSSADALVTPQEQDDYGNEQMRQMRALGMVVDDALLESWLQDIGYRLVAASAKPKQKYTFFMVKDDDINAFALPGGYIAVNTGLVTITRSESELAGVMAHEIGHITQNHLVRAFEESKKAGPMMALVLLGALAAGGAGGDAAAGVLVGGQGLIMQKQINFTRADETEADRTGIQTLANAGYDPNAMASFFERMSDAMRAGQGESIYSLPELLQSHPVTANRISDAKARAKTLIDQQVQRPVTATLDPSSWNKATAPIPFVTDPTRIVTTRRGNGNGDTGIYAMMRERARVLSGDAGRQATLYAQNMDRPGQNTPANHYGLALALTRSGRPQQAQAELKPLLAKSPDDIVLRLAMADALRVSDQRADALRIYADLHERSPRNRAVAIDYGKALVMGGDKADGRKAAVMLKPLLDNSDDAEVYRAFARASELAGDTVRGQEAYADAAALSGRPFDAMEQYKRLLDRPNLDFYERSRIQARIADLTPLVLELRKRKIPTDDNPDGRRDQLGETGKKPNQACMGNFCLSAGAQ
ncbi:M48 family metalloprotease [Pinirhizobacter sp.]|jgi:predicted Zn-dependent protease|uniref:M48 family metalloprotease n=1 Tax=Pinirhizobacter sp. TaxID=2950432 RepID=UPI002F3F6B4D